MEADHSQNENGNEEEENEDEGSDHIEIENNEDDDEEGSQSKLIQCKKILNRFPSSFLFSFRRYSFISDLRNLTSVFLFAI